MPRLLHVRSDETGGNLTHGLIRGALEETHAPRAGGETILSKLSELMFLHAVRQHIDSLPEESTGWLAGLRDRHVGAALRLMHGQPAQAWTLDALAREVGLSRSAFAERFTRIMGTPAMQYLRSEEHPSELQSLMRISSAVFCLNKKINTYSQVWTTDTTRNTIC